MMVWEPKKLSVMNSLRSRDDLKNDGNKQMISHGLPSKDNPDHTALLPFEKESMSGTSCNPPLGTPQRCCVGATSAGGDLHWKKGTCAGTNYNNLPPIDFSFVRTLIATLAQLNKRLVIVGDSIMYQVVAGLECTWLRAGCTASNRSIKRTTSGFWKYGVHSIEQWNVTCGTHRAPPITFFLQYRPQADLTEIDEQLSKADIYVFNTGLHYLKKEVDGVFRNETKAWLRRVLEWASVSPQSRYVFMRETTAQHRDSLGGEWDTSMNTTQCVPLRWDATQARNWRNNAVRHWSERVGFDLSPPSKNKNDKTVRLHWLPLYESTVPRYALHPGFSTKCEPTHYCQHPAMWQWVWSNFTMGLREQLLLKLRIQETT